MYLFHEPTSCETRVSHIESRLKDDHHSNFSLLRIYNSTLSGEQQLNVRFRVLHIILQLIIIIIIFILPTRVPLCCSRVNGQGLQV